MLLDFALQLRSIEFANDPPIVFVVEICGTIIKCLAMIERRSRSGNLYIFCHAISCGQQKRRTMSMNMANAMETQSHMITEILERMKELGAVGRREKGARGGGSEASGGGRCGGPFTR